MDACRPAVTLVIAACLAVTGCAASTSPPTTPTPVNASIATSRPWPDQAPTDSSRSPPRKSLEMAISAPADVADGVFLIRLRAESESSIKLEVWDVAGRRIRNLAREQRILGVHLYTWDRRDRTGSLVASGVYFLVLRTPSGVSIRRLVLI